MKYKKYILFLVSCLITLISFGQQNQTIGTTSSFVIAKNLLGADTGYVHKTNYNDTGTLNLSNYLPNHAGAVGRTGDQIWMRSNDLTKWVGIGGQPLVTNNTNTITFSGDGTWENPLTAASLISGQNNNILQIGRAHV